MTTLNINTNRTSTTTDNDGENHDTVLTNLSLRIASGETLVVIATVTVRKEGKTTTHEIQNQLTGLANLRDFGNGDDDTVDYLVSEVLFERFRTIEQLVEEVNEA